MKLPYRCKFDIRFPAVNNKAKREAMEKAKDIKREGGYGRLGGRLNILEQ